MRIPNFSDLWPFRTLSEALWQGVTPFALVALLVWLLWPFLDAVYGVVSILPNEHLRLGLAP